MAAKETLEQRVGARLHTLGNAQLLRTLQPPRGIDFSSNDYLALARHPALAAAMIEAVRAEGCGSTGSRLLRGERELFAEVEARFASFKGTSRSLFLSSGYLANLAVLTTFPERGDVIYSDERNYASLIDGIRLSAAGRVIFPHRDVAALTRLLDAHTSGHAFIVTESLFSMDGSMAPLAAYAALARARGASLIVDEAHAVGVYGPRGTGLIEADGVDRDVFLSVNTAGKALGVSGAFVAGPAWAIEYLVQRARPFIFSTAPPPAIVAALDASLAIVAAEPARRTALLHLSGHLRRRLFERGIAVPDFPSQIISLVVGENDRALELAHILQADGYDVRAIRPPSVPQGTARLRVTVNVTLTEDVLDRFAGAVSAALKGCSPWSAVSS